WRWLRARGCGVRVVTNQSGVRRGWVNPRNLHAIHERMRWRMWREAGVWRRFSGCPHHPAERCGCRKPAVAGIRADLQRFRERPVGLVGDRSVDQQAAARLGIPFVAAGTLPEGLDRLS
ncbi:MAG: hypothetical protein L3J76_02275, partial [Candidatus Hydrothermae bacterium]|nr:hypothetical protein [Candidatus Hydrothermae bacterium]